MFDLPASTELRKIIPKKVLYDKFALASSERAAFDKALKQLCLVAEISEQTVSLPAGEKGRGIFVLEMTLKEECSEKLSIRLCKIIHQRLIVAEILAEKVRLSALCEETLLRSGWCPLQEAKLALEGLTLDKVWENLLRQIGGLTQATGRTIEEEVALKARREKLEADIKKLEAQIRKEKQLKRQMELKRQLKQLRVEGNEGRRGTRVPMGTEVFR